MLTVEIREDRCGPGEHGWGNTPDCGCIMTHVVRALALGDKAQYSYEDEEGFAKLRKALMAHGAPRDKGDFNSLVDLVQRYQDRAWREIAAYQDGGTSGTRQLAVANMMTALAAARKLGVKVVWIR